MQTPASQRPRFAALVTLAVAVALAGSIWSLMDLQGCFGCGEKGKLIGRLPLPLVGTVFYGALLAVLLVRRFAVLAGVALLSAASVHLVLLALLLSNGIVCLPCYVAGGAALVGAAATLLGMPRLRRTAIFLLPAMIAVTAAGIWAARGEATTYRRRVAQSYAIDAVEELGAPAAGRVHLFHWKRPGCSACEMYESKVLPWILERHGSVLDVSSKTTEEEGVPTPIVVVFGKRCVFFPMIPLPSELELAIAVALEQREFDAADFTRGHLLKVEYSDP